MKNIRSIVLITLLFGTSLIGVSQEGTKQFMPNSTDRLWMEIYRASDKLFATYSATDKERLYIYLNSGETLYFGMKMASFQYGNANRTTIRIKNPVGTIVYPESRFPISGENGYIDDHTEAITGPNGAILNGTTITGGYDALTYTATTSGNHYIEFEMWRYDIGTGGNYPVTWRRSAIEFFDATVTDASGNIITNPGEPNVSAGRLWSKGWAFTTTSYDLYPIQTEFYVFTADEFVNKVKYEMKPYSFNFVANSYGVDTDPLLNVIEAAQSQDGDLTNTSDISEYRIFLNDPDRSIWPNTTLPPPIVKVWFEETQIYDYDYDRNPQLLDFSLDTIYLEKNNISCPYSSVTVFRIESNIDGFTTILLDIDGNGYSTDGNDRALSIDVKKGLNYVLWNFRNDAGTIIANGSFTASATFLGRGPAHFPLYDVESLSGIETSSIRPFNKLGPTLYWDDTQITDWGDPGGAMTETARSQLTIDNHIPRVWVYDNGREWEQHNGNLATLNSWFNAIDLGLPLVDFNVSTSLTKCINGDAPFIGDLYMEGELNTDLLFAEEDFNEKFFDPNDASLDSIIVLSLPANGSLELSGVPINANDTIDNNDITNITFTPNTDWSGISFFEWNASNGSYFAEVSDTVFIIINTDPTISNINDTTICTNTSLANVPFIVGDAESNPGDLNIVAYSHDPLVVPNGNITLGGSGANRTITVTPPANTSGYTIIYVKVDDGLTFVIEEFAVYIGPSITFQGDTTVCDGSPLSLTAVEFGADSYSWEFEGSEVRTTRNITIDPFTTDSVGTYTLTVQKDGCSASRDINVSIAPITTFTGDILVCTGEDISLSADETVATLYSWKKGVVEIGTSKVLTITNADAGDNGSDYTLEVTKEGCNNTSPQFTISVIAPPNTNLTLINDTVTSGMNATITVQSAENGITYNAYIGTTLVGTDVGADADLDITIQAIELSLGNNVIILKAQNANCELDNATNTNVFVRTPGITVSAISGNTSETGTTATFTIVLDAEPTDDVIIGLNSDDTSEGTVAPLSVTFTTANWDTPQTVTVTGVNDDIDDGNQSFSIITSDATSTDGNYSGMVVDDVSVINDDDGDNAAITVSALSNNTVEDGTTGTFTIVLESEPTANVTIALSSDNTDEGTETPASVTFTPTNWDTPQTITITGVDDDIDDGDQAYNIVTADATSTDGNYNGMVVADVAVTNIDDDISSVNVSVISGNTTEAGITATFTIELTSEPIANVTVNFNSDDTGEGTVAPASATFTSVTWGSPQTITVTGVNDDIDDGNQPFNIITSNAISTDPTYSGLLVADVPVTNQDDDVAGISVSAISGNTSETGTTATFTIVLDTEPTANVSVGLSSSDTEEGTVAPASATFTPANWDTPQTITVTGVNDDIQDGSQAFSIITAAATSTDGNYNGINADDVAVINDDDTDTAGISVSAISGNTSETGTTATFTIVLDSEPTANVSIGLSSNDTGEGTVAPASATFTPANWDTPQTITVTGVDDDIQDGSQAFSIITAAATSADGNYNGLNANDVAVTNDDDTDTAGISVSAISGNTSESGTTATFTIVLDSEPTANVTIGLTSDDLTEGTVAPPSVTFTPGNWNNAQTITVTGVNDALADGDQTYSIVTAAATSTDGNYNGINPDDVTVINIDGDVASINVSVISGNTAEDGTTATFTIVLTSQPTANVSIGLSSDDPGEGTVAPASVTFTSGDWDTPQTVTVTGVNDDIDDGNVAYNIITAAATSGDADYNGMNANDVAVINDDDTDTAGISVSAISGNTAEDGTTATFTIELDSEPTANVSIGLSSDDPGEGTVAPVSVTFTSGNWDTPQTITVTGVNDDIDDGNVAYNIITAAATSTDGNYNTMDPDNVAVINDDDADTAGISVSAISGNTAEDGTTATFTIELDSEPLANVTIGLSSDDPGEGTVAPVSVTFTSGDWDTPQTITVTGVDDNIDDGNEAFNIVTAAATSGDGSYNTMNANDVAVINDDDDTAGISVSTISGNTTEAAATATFTIELNSEPTANVTIGLSSDDPGEGTVSAPSVTFTPANWNIAQTLTVTGVDDNIDDGNQTYNIVTAAATSTDGNYNTMNANDVAVINQDDDTAGITVSAISGNTSETGTIATFTIVLDSEPTANVTIGVSSDDPGEGSVAPVSITFTAVNWNVAQTITVTGVDDDIDDGNQAYNIITATAVSTDGNYGGVNPNDVAVINNDDGDTAGITVSLISGNTTEAGGTATFTIVLNSEPTANVSIGLSSDDLTEGTVSPASVTFTSGNWDIAQTVTVTGVNDDVDDDNQSFNIVTAGATSTDGNYNTMNPDDVFVINQDDDDAGISVTPISNNTAEDGATATFTIVLDSEPLNDVIIGLSSDDTSEGTVSSPSITFTPANWDIPQTITITGVDDDIDDGNQFYNIITAAAASADPDYAGRSVADVAVVNDDDDVAGITVSLISGNTTEAGTTATFTIVLDSEPTADVAIDLSSDDTSEGTVSPASVTFTPANWDTPQTVTVTGVNDDVDDDDQTFSIVTADASTTDLRYTGMVVDDVTVTNIDDDTAGTTVSLISGNTAEDGTTATFTIVLDSEPTANVSINITSNDLTEGTVLPVSVTFTSGDWDTPQTITVTGVDDDFDDGNIAYTIVTSDATSTDPDYSGMVVDNVAVTNDDDDAVGFTIAETGGTSITAENGSNDIFTVVLDAEPLSNVVFDISVGDPSEGSVDLTTLTFTPGIWDVAQTVTITGEDDAIIDGTQTYSITVSINDALSEDNFDPLPDQLVSVDNTDNDAAGVTISSVSNNTSEDGTTATFTMELNTQPTDDVTIGLSSNDPGEGTIVLTSATFTSANWDTPQTITITGINDDIDDGNQTFSIVTSTVVSTDGNYNGLNPNDISAINEDDDTAGITVSLISGNTREDGATATFTIVLDTEPTNDVTIGLSSDDLTEGTPSPTSVTFTAGDWNIPQTITVTGVNDDVDDGDITYNIITAAATSADGVYNGMNPDDVVVVNEDNDVVGITVSLISNNTSELGTTATFTIVLDTEPTDDVSIGITSDDLTEGSVSPASVTFTAGDWDTPQTITVTGVDDNLNDGDVAYNIITAEATSADENYNGLDPDDVVVINLNDGTPVANDDSAIIDENDNTNINVLRNDTGLDDGGITVVIGTEPTNGEVIVNVDNTVTYSPNRNYYGSDNFSYQVCDRDSECSTANVSITINPVNNHIPIAIDDSRATEIDTDLDIDVLLNDNGLEDGGLVVTENIAPLNGTVSINPDNTINYDPNPGFSGSDSFEYQVCDMDGDCATARVSITVKAINYIPNGVDDYVITIRDIPVEINVLSNDTDLDDGGIVVTMFSAAVNGVGLDNPDNTITYYPVPDFVGSDSLEYMVQDADGDYSFAKVYITVNATNDPPIAIPDSYSIDEGGTLSIDDIAGVLSNDTDLENNTLTAILATDVRNGTLTLNADGSFDYIHDGSETILDSFEYYANDSTDDGNTTLATITINPINDPPVSVADNYSVERGQDLIVNTATGVLANDTDNENDDLTAILVTDVSHGTLDLNPDGSFTYTHTQNALVSDSFTYRANDSTDNGNTVTVTIRYTNTAPVAQPDYIELYRENDTIVNVIANDVDDNLDLSTLSIITNPLVDIAQVNEDGTISLLYSQEVAFYGADSLEYEICDDERECDTEWLYITVLISGEDNDYGIETPNTFSPNGDGINDFFVIPGLEEYPNNELVIFNRWGNEVYRSSHYQNNWDGKMTNKSQELPTGTYFYILKIEGGNPIKGFVYLTR